MDDTGPSPLAIASAVCGALALVGHGCCCLPIISYIAPMVVVTLELVGLILGFVARSQAAQEGRSEPVALAGIGLSIAAILVSIVYVMMMGGLVMAYLGLVFAAIATGQ